MFLLWCSNVAALKFCIFIDANFRTRWQMLASGARARLSPDYFNAMYFLHLNITAGWLSTEKARVFDAPRPVRESPPTFHESGVRVAVVVEVGAMDVRQAVISQLGSVAETLQDGIHETLENINREMNRRTRRRAECLHVRLQEVKQTQKKHLLCCPGSSVPRGLEESCSIPRERILVSSCICWG